MGSIRTLLRRPKVWVFCGTVLIFVVFSIWYRGGQTPLSPDEQNQFLKRITQLPVEVQEFVDLKATQEFMKTDDGKPFFVVNIFKLREFADYGTATPHTITGAQAFNDFSRKALPIWIKHSAYPVFVGQIDNHFANDWDVVSIIRYRSRRDFMEIQTSEDFVRVLPHRFAAFEDNIRLKLPGIVLPTPFLASVIAILGIWLVLLLSGPISRSLKKD